MSDLDLKLSQLRQATETIEPSAASLTAIHAAIDLEGPAVLQPANPLGAPAVAKPLALSVVKGLGSVLIALAVVGAGVAAQTHSDDPLTWSSLQARMSQLRGLQPVVSGVVRINGKDVPCEPSPAQVNALINEKVPPLLRDLADAGHAHVQVATAQVEGYGADGGRLPSCESLMHPKSAAPAKR